MAVREILPVLLITAVIGTTCDKSRGFQTQSNHVNTQFGEILRPPPPPPLSKLFPVPFHGGNRVQRQNLDLGYQYPPPPPPPPSTLQQQSNNFRFPAPFYKQYNFNFVPPPQPFTSTTPSPNVFQKVSNWLFPSTHLGYDSAAQPITSLDPVRKECNPCNLVPWIPVIRYDLSAKNLPHNANPTYGAPSPTASSDVLPFTPQPFVASNNIKNSPPIRYSAPHSAYGPPSQYQTAAPFIATPSSTYGPPSPTHTIAGPSKYPPGSSYGVPSSSLGILHLSDGVPGYSYGPPSSSYSAPSSTYTAPSLSYGLPSSTYGSPSSTYGPPSSTYGVPAASYGPPRTTSGSFVPITQTNYQPAIESDVEIFSNTAPSGLSGELELPKISNPTGFRNSYGEPISSNVLGIPFSVTATAAESTRVKTEVLPNNAVQNGSIALANPKPFTLQKGRNIHTLQPVALPNLSVSPLPPIFNARPFRTSSLLDYFGNNINDKQPHKNKNYDIKNVSVTEFSHSVEHPITIVQSPVIDFEFKNVNQSKTYRNIVNEFIIDHQRDISSQASEDHVATTKNTQEISDISFETTGPGYDNDIYDIPNILKNKYQFLSKDKNGFADLSKATQSDVDNYRTESNLQSIDSPLLYLKPSAPHKEFDNFLLDLSTVSYGSDYELYDEVSTTMSPRPHLPTHIWDNHNTDSKESSQLAPTAQGDDNKPKIVQIVIPYTTGQQVAPNHQYYDQSPEWASVSDEEFQGRKVPTQTENYSENVDAYSTEGTTPEDVTPTPLPDNYESGVLNTPAILNDLYDVKGPPFDIIKLQNNIDDWTAQQFSQTHQTTQRIRVTPKLPHAKQIPDEYFATTASPLYSYATTSSYDYYDDHESASSIQHSVTENKTISIKPLKEYNILQKLADSASKYKNKNNIVDGDIQKHKPHIYTAASTFRGSSTTFAPWGKIETSISPLTKEKVYVVTSKPWRENANVTDWYENGLLENFKSISGDNDGSSDNLPFKSPRFINRPSFSSFDGPEIMKSDASYGISRSWHQWINDLETDRRNQTHPTTTSEPVQTNSHSLHQTSSSNTTDGDSIT